MPVTCLLDCVGCPFRDKPVQCAKRVEHALAVTATKR